MLANRSSIDALRADAQRTKEKELEDLANTHAEEKGNVCLISAELRDREKNLKHSEA